jgi:hypothetical protein
VVAASVAVVDFTKSRLLIMRGLRRGAFQCCDAGCEPYRGCAASASAVAAQLVPAAEIHESCPCGNPMSKSG